MATPHPTGTSSEDFCSRCSQQLPAGTKDYNLGNPRPSRRRPVEDRFWEKVVKGATPDECWGWTGSTALGYGCLTVGNRIDRTKKRTTINVLSWRINVGPIPEGKWVLHHCDNRLCCNPRHLYLGTAVENGRDARLRQRHPEKSATHCKSGLHEWTPENTIWTKHGRTRICRACAKAGAKRRREARRNANGG